MSKEIETNLPRHRLCEFWGGDNRGVCVRVTCSDPMIGDLDQEGYVQLTMEDASELIGHLAKFVKEEAVRRQSLLRKQLEDLKLADRSVFHEIAALDPNLFDVPASSVKFVAALCPKTSTTASA